MSESCMYPGSFDPITNGHLNVIRRSLRIFPKVVIGVAVNIKKAPLFTLEERTDMISRVIQQEFPPEDSQRVVIASFEGLTVDFAKKHNASVIVRGLRAVSDFEYEFQMASMNRKLAPDIEMMFMMTEEQNFYISSQTVKEVAALGGCIKGLVPPLVREELFQKFKTS